MKTSKAQVSAYDFIIAMTLFLFMFITLHSIWAGNFNATVENQMRTQTQESGYKALEVLVKSSGYPLDWETDPNNAEVIGLAKRKNILDNDKVEAFKNMGLVNYELSKNLLGLEIFDYRFEMDALEDINDFVVGADLPSDKEIYSTTRVVNYKGAEAVAQIYVF